MVNWATRHPWSTIISNDTNSSTQDDAPLSFMQTLSSVAAAAFGVQSSANRERDFKRGRPLHFIMIGILFTVAFVLVVAGVVTLVLP